jgi:spore coat polysaccharide biosynthesis protein SpsF (cytidylyltransferase family)
MKFRILLQVRSGSIRLPYKCFLLIKNIPAIIYLYKRIALLKKNLIIVTSDDSSDSYLRYLLKQHKINFFTGSLYNVKKRFLDSTIDMKDEDILVRLTGDNLIVNSKLIYECLKIFQSQKNDYMCINQKKNNVPLGLSVEIFKLKLLREDGLNSKLSKEHVTYNFIKKNNTLNIKNPYKKKLHIFRYSLDYIEDYFLLKKKLGKCNLKSDWKILCKSLLSNRINKKNNFKFSVKKTNELPVLEKNKIFNIKRTFWKHSLKSQKSFFIRSYKPGDIHILLYNNANLIGYSCLRFGQSNKYKYIVLDAFIVSPKYYSKGISNILLAKSMNEIIISKLDAYLYANKNSLSLYKKFNWKLYNNYQLFKKKPFIRLMKFAK